jgi:heme/copper-type cytochrome/quinol oxidase subunit 2
MIITITIMIITIIVIITTIIIILRYKQKAPSGPPIFEAFAVDVFCTKTR